MQEPENYPLQLKALAEYDADIVIFRLSENCSKESCEQHDFAKGFMTSFDGMEVEF